MIVVLPETVEQVSDILCWCQKEGVKVVPRGSGTSLSGGALPLAAAVLLGMAKFNRGLDIDYEDRLVTEQHGVTKYSLHPDVDERGLYAGTHSIHQLEISTEEGAVGNTW